MELPTPLLPSKPICGVPGEGGGLTGRVCSSDLSRVREEVARNKRPQPKIELRGDGGEAPDIHV